MFLNFSDGFCIFFLFSWRGSGPQTLLPPPRTSTLERLHAKIVALDQLQLLRRLEDLGLADAHQTTRV